MSQDSVLSSYINHYNDMNFDILEDSPSVVFLTRVGFLMCKSS